MVMVKMVMKRMMMRMRMVEMVRGDQIFLISTYMIALALHCTKKLTPRTNIARGFHKSGVWSLAYLTLILEYSEFPWIDAMPLNNSINVAVIVT